MANNGEQCTGGRGGIRTHGTLAGTPVFKTGALNRSATLPNALLMGERVAECKLWQGWRPRKSTGRSGNHSFTTLRLSPFPPPSGCDILIT